MGKLLYGLDISLKNTGIAIYDLEEKKFVFVDSFNTEKIKATYEYKELEVNALKLKKITEWLREIIKKYPPYIASIERMFSRFPLETQAIAKATGVIQCMLWNKPQTLYPPKKVKATIFHGDATKDEVRDEIAKRYPELIMIMKNDDESDAVAVAICHLIHLGLIDWEKSEVKEKKTRKKKENKE